MLAISHLLIALLAAKALRFDSIWSLAVAAFFAVLPDMDMPVGFGKINPFARYIYAKFGHRNITHSLIFALLATSILAINQELWLAALLGIFSHYASDMLTYTGIPLFWPYKKNFVLLGGPLLTGSWHELVIVFIAALGIVVLTLSGGVIQW